MEINYLAVASLEIKEKLLIIVIESKYMYSGISYQFFVKNQIVMKSTYVLSDFDENKLKTYSMTESWQFSIQRDTWQRG